MLAMISCKEEVKNPEVLLSQYQSFLEYTNSLFPDWVQLLPVHFSAEKSSMKVWNFVCYHKIFSFIPIFKTDGKQTISLS